MPQQLRLTASQLEQIVEHARICKPEEACGILAGDGDGTVRRVFLMENAEHSSTFYMMDSREQFQVFDAMESESLELVAIFHSHPHSPAYPSERDCELAFYPDSLYLIVSLMDSQASSHAFQIEGGVISETEIVVTDAN